MYLSKKAKRYLIDFCLKHDKRKTKRDQNDDSKNKKEKIHIVSSKYQIYWARQRIQSYEKTF